MFNYTSTTAINVYFILARHAKRSILIKVRFTYIGCLPVAAVGVLECILNIVFIWALCYVQLEEIHSDSDCTSESTSTLNT